MVLSISPGGWRPTAREASRFRDYGTQIKMNWGSVFVRVGSDGRVYRFHSTYYRVPSTKQFILRMRAGHTPAEREIAEAELELMPRGWWAKHHGGDWSPRIRATAGYYYYKVVVGTPVDDDPFVQLELEQMIDNYRPDRLSDAAKA